jgi:competence protein ComEC
VISVGQNKYGHPAPETLGRLLKHHVEVWRTDRDGNVNVTTDGQRMTVQAGGRSTTYDVR